MKTTRAQQAAATAVATALAQAKRCGLALRVFDGSVLLVSKAHLADPRYLANSTLDMNDWLSEALECGGGISADGGAGV